MRWPAHAEHEEVDGAKAPLEPSTARVGRVERIRSIIGAWLITMGTPGLHRMRYHP